MAKMMKTIVKKGLNIFGINAKDLYQKIAYWSIIKAQKQQALSDMGQTLRQIAPDISQQESRENQKFNAYWELKRRTLQVFNVN